MTNSLVDTLKKGSKSKNADYQFGCISLMFKLLEIFAREKNPFAPIIYRAITFAFIENHSDEGIRDYIF